MVNHIIHKKTAVQTICREIRTYGVCGERGLLTNRLNGNIQRDTVFNISLSFF
jgi:hypothetical protein